MFQGTILLKYCGEKGSFATYLRQMWIRYYKCWFSRLIETGTERIVVYFINIDVKRLHYLSKLRTNFANKWLEDFGQRLHAFLMPLVEKHTPKYQINNNAMVENVIRMLQQNLSDIYF